MTENSDIMARANELAVVHSPGAVARSVVEFLENIFFGTFRAIGWTFGRAWFLIFVIGLALKDGFDAGRPAKANHQLPNPPAPRPVDLVEDDRILSQYDTPFGIPFGPNVHASHD